MHMPGAGNKPGVSEKEQRSMCLQSSVWGNWVGDKAGETGGPELHGVQKAILRGFTYPKGFTTQWRNKTSVGLKETVKKETSICNV